MRKSGVAETADLGAYLQRMYPCEWEAEVDYFLRGSQNVVNIIGSFNVVNIIGSFPAFFYVKPILAPWQMEIAFIMLAP